LSDCWGFDRGTPIDRYYIEAFLELHRRDIHGRVLEVKDSGYTDRFGCGVDRRDVLDINPANPKATIVADLTAAYAIPSGQFDCFILTQTLQLVADPHASIAHAHRILRPGGVLLATVPTVSRVDRPHESTDSWRFTPAGCGRLFGDVFRHGQVTLYPYGNVLAAVAFLAGMAREELSKDELALYDEYYPVLVGVRAEKHPPPGDGMTRE
jgi:SAM-dependent methyltransferase